MPESAQQSRPSSTQIENLRSKLHALQFRALRGSYSDDDLREFRLIAEEAPHILGVTKKHMTEITGLSIGYWRTTKGYQDRPRLSNYLLVLSTFSDLCDQRLPKSHSAPKTTAPTTHDPGQIASITNIATSLLNIAREEKSRMLSRIPNDTESREDYEKHLSIIDFLIDGLEKISEEIRRHYETGENRSGIDRKINQFRNEIEKWWNHNSASAIDWCIRMPALSASIGMLSSAGANMPIATAVASALIAGPKALSVLQKQKKR